MSVTRDKRNGTWYVQAWYKTYDGKRAHKVKRGFKTKPEALAWERDFYAVQAGDMDMKLVDFLELYKKDMGPRLRLNTWKTKESIITKRILPYLGEKRMNQIAPVDIVRWQNELMLMSIRLSPIGTAVVILDQIHPTLLGPNPCDTAWGSCNPGRPLS